jgi:hypothetical protein
MKTRRIALALATTTAALTALVGCTPIGGQDTTSTPTASPAPSLINDPAQPDWGFQGYWYCWNLGALNPHHLGYRVPNDHLCTWGELRSIGFAG